MKKLIGYVFIFVLGFLACALILRTSGAGIYNAGASSRGRETIGEALRQPSRPRATLVNSSAVADAAAKVEPAVVNIDIQGRQAAGGLRGLLPGGYRGFEGSGSGIILSGDGYLVTNNHVVAPIAERGGQIRITLDNGKVFTNVRIIGRDPRSDIAVLKIDNVSGLPAATLGDSEKLRVGDWAIAVGNPLGFNSTVTLGIVSALNRRNFRNDNEALDKVIQTDAAINPGNSGGALADISGQVVGINTAIISPGSGGRMGTNIGIGFAIPINQARRIIDQLVKGGEVVRPYLGVRYSTVEDARERVRPGVVLPKDNEGAVILGANDEPAVIAGSPADKAGLREFDVIRRIGGREVDGIEIVKDEIQSRGVGDRVPMTILRAGRTIELTVTLQRMPVNFGVTPQDPKEDSDLFELP